MQKTILTSFLLFYFHAVILAANTNPYPTLVYITPGTINICEDDTASATATVSPSSQYYRVKFEMSEPGIARVTPESATGGDTKLTISGRSAGTTTLLGKLDGVVATSVTVNVIKVKIKTQGTSFQVKQERDSTQSLTAERSPSGGSITWTVTGPGKDFVTWQADGANPSTITIKMKTPVSNSWTSDSSITVRAADGYLDSCYDEREVKLIKFKRDSKTMPGSQPIKVSFNSEDQTANAIISYTGNSGSSTLVSVSVRDYNSQEIAQRTPVDVKSGIWTARYRGYGDACKGKYSLQAYGEAYAGSTTCSGTYSGFFGNADVYMAAGVAAGVDNDALPITDPSCGAGYDGTLIGHSLGLGIGFDGKSVSGSLGYTVSFSSSQQSSLSASSHPSGTGVIDSTADVDHSEGGQIQRSHVINVGASVNQEQQHDDEWYLSSYAYLGYDVYSSSKTELTFNPDI